jgi:hypothetical protein
MPEVPAVGDLGHGCAVVPFDCGEEVVSSLIAAISALKGGSVRERNLRPLLARSS